MKPKTINICRLAARKINGGLIAEQDDWPQSSVSWVSIGEPDDKESIVHNGWLDRVPNLKLQFWDLTEAVPLLDGYGTYLYPPSEKDAAQIVDFLVNNKGRNIIANCAAGVSRSGAVCAFLEKHMNYEWPEYFKQMARPNKLLVRMMEEYYYK